MTNTLTANLERLHILILQVFSMDKDAHGHHAGNLHELMAAFADAGWCDFDDGDVRQALLHMELLGYVKGEPDGWHITELGRAFAKGTLPNDKGAPKC